jgi:hypothetical protein
MTSRQLAAQIRNLLIALIDSEIATTINPVVDRKLGPLTRITWRPPHGLDRPRLISSVFATVAEYRRLIDEQSFSAVLYDGAIVQLSYDFVGDSLVGHRLCYYPCPFDLDLDLFPSEPIGDIIAFYSESKDISVNLRSPLRFDYDEANAKMGHPSVHMHVIKPDCRWPVTHPLSVGDFVRFVFRHFYPALWSAHNFLRKWSQGDPRDRVITPEDETELYIACGRPMLG